MSEHPIEGLMVTAMNSIEDMIDVNTIIGETIETYNNRVIIQIKMIQIINTICIVNFRKCNFRKLTKRCTE